MATLEAGSRLENISRSVNVFVASYIVLPLGITAYYRGQDPLDPVPAKVLMVDLIMLSAIEHVMAGPGHSLAIWKECALNLNYMEYVEFGVTGREIHAPWATAESIREMFLTTTAIPIYDYATMGTPRVNALMVWEMPTLTDIPTPPDSGITQINIRVPLRYHEVIQLS